ncbi:hypothetical protein D3C79_636560 [compost metagenome]
MSGEVSHGKGIGATLFKDHLIALKLQFLHQLRKRATRLDRRARRAYVTGEKDGGPCLSGLAHQSIQRAEQRLATPRLFRAVNKADLHVENQERAWSVSLRASQRIRGKKKTLSIAGGSLGFADFLAHDTSHDPPRAVVVLVVD